MTSGCYIQLHTYMISVPYRPTLSLGYPTTPVTFYVFVLKTISKVQSFRIPNKKRPEVIAVVTLLRFDFHFAVNLI